MAEPTVQQQPVGRRLGVLARGVPRLRRKPRSGPHEPERPRVPARHGVLSLHLDLVIGDADGAAATLERILGVLQPGDRVYLVGPPKVAESRVDDRPFTIWA